MEVRLGSDDTDGISIQDGWRDCDISDLCQLQRGFDITEATRKAGAIPVYSSSGVSYFHSEARLYPPAVITGRKGMLGRVFFVEEPCWPHDTTLWVKDFKGNDPRYVSIFLSQFHLERFDAATSVPTLNRNNLVGVRITLPPPPEQRAIATALSDVDALLGGLDRLIAKKRDLKHAAMQQLLTGKIRLSGFGPTKGVQQFAYGSIPDDWSVKAFKTISSMNGRIGWQGLKQSEFTENPDDAFLITGMNFQDGKIRWDEVYRVSHRRYEEAPAIQLQVGDVLMTKDGTIGKLLYVDSIPHPGKASLNSHLLVFRPLAREYDPKFLFYQLSSPTFARHIELHKSGSTFFGLTQAATGKYPFILPSVSEQTAIATALTEIDEELVALEQRLAKTRALKQGMMQELLTGRTRLVVAQEAIA